MDAEIVVIGAGVVGLSIAQKMACQGYSVILLEKERQFGMGTSSRNSEVIHAGIYYQTKSLKASLCLKGKNLLYKHCKQYQIPFKKTGKLFLAITPEEIPRLELTHKQAKNNHIEDLVYLDQDQLKNLEPELNGVAALLSPSSGIFDTHYFMKSLLSIGERNEMIFVSCSPVEGAEPISNGWKIYIGGKEPCAITSKTVVNSAGLYATRISHEIFTERKIPKLYPVKGAYIRYSGKSPIKHIVYPAFFPGQIEERVDATPDMAGSLRFGPSTDEASKLDDFKMPENIIDRFIPSITRFLPNIDATRLHPDISGIRPKIYGPGEAVEDFRFDWSPQGNWLDLWGMESPALTASLAIAEHVDKLFTEQGILD